MCVGVERCSVCVCIGSLQGVGVEYDMVMFVCTTSSLWVENTKDGVKLPFLFCIHTFQKA